MSNILSNINNQIIELIKKAIDISSQNSEMEDVGIGDIILEIPRDKKNGDFSTNIAMQLTKVLKKPPKAIAEAVLKNIDISETDIERVDIAGPGFINFYMKAGWITKVLYDVEEQKDNYGRINIGRGKKVMVEFVSANPTGPMHMGNARGGALGDCLSSVLDWAGYDVTREFYINDAGNQIEKFGNSLEARYIQLIKGDTAVEFPEDGYHGEDITEHMKDFIVEEGDKYIDSPSEERKEVFVKFALERNIKKLEEHLVSYGINYDVWFRESSLYENNEVESTVEFLKEKGYTYGKDEALWFKASELGAEKDEVLQRKNGYYTYFAADIAYHRNKFIKRGFDKVIDIWGADHHGHIARMKGAMRALGCDPEELNIIIMQLVRLLRDGEVARMSKRTGRLVTLMDLLEETGKDAARFFFNMRQADTHLDFDLDLAVSKSNENPVFYVQYAHARICSIIDLLNEEGVKVQSCTQINLQCLTEEAELDLLRQIAQFPEEIKVSAETLEPSKVTRYVIDLAGKFHSFYNACRVKVDDKEVMAARLKLIDCTRIVIKNVLNMMGVSAPEKM
jgi:arginyl-tRNA synthetase